ncbi:MAG: type II toxin-antitoxin system RelE/ParE family toxin [Devosia sp.]
MRELRFSRRARQHLDDIDDYLFERTGDKGAGAKLVRAIEARMFRLAGSPATFGRPRPELGPGLRSLPHGPYLIFFIATERHIDVLHVLHARRDLGRYFRGR